MSEFFRRMRAFFRRDRLDRDLEEEMGLHLEMKAAETGDPASSRRAFGNPLLLREQSKDLWAWRWLEELAQDTRFALRLSLRNPGFAVTSLVSLALGIGITTAVYTLADTILWRPLAAPHPERLVSVYHRAPGEALVSSSFPEYEFYRDHNEVLSGLAAYLRLPVVLRTSDAAEEVRGELVSGNFFSVLGVRPAAGRVFDNSESGPVVVLSHALWRRRFNLDPGVLGRIVVIGGHDFTVIGIAPRSFRGVVMDWGGPPDLWVPASAYREAVPVLAKFPVLESWAMQSFPLIGRLRPGETVERARAAFSVLSAQVAPLREQGLKRPLDLRPVVLPLQQARFWPTYRGPVTRFLAVLAGVAALVLLIACFNVGNLLVALASGRRKEIAIRLAMGVSRGRLARQLLIESLLLSLLGGTSGLAVAAGAIRLLSSYPGAFGAPLVLTAGLDAGALACALLVALVSAVAFGLAPVRQAARLDLTSALKAGSLTARPRSISPRNVLVAAQVTLSLVVLVGAGLFARSLRNLLAEDVVSEPGNLLVARFDLSGWGYDEARARLFYRQIVERVEAIPGVRGAALVWTVPLSGTRGETGIVVDGSRPAQADRNGVSPRYFEVAGLQLLRGREFSPRDGGRSPLVAVVNEQAARTFWPGQDPLGKRIRLARDARDSEVIGVIRDGRFGKLRDPVRPTVYFPLEQSFLWASALEVRTVGNPLQYTGAIRDSVGALNRELPLGAVMTWQSHRRRGLNQESLAAALLSGLGVAALMLAAVGVYGMVSFSVARRAHEIAVRSALGASASSVLALVLWRGLAPVLAGIGVGVALALLSTRYAAAFLYGISASDVVTFGASGFLLASTAAAAACLPARRATRIDPMEALRHE
ncbi:MAG: ABC transporter permease [Bryobacteraceae bacterium]